MLYDLLRYVCMLYATACLVRVSKYNYENGSAKFNVSDLITVLFFT